jgi:hypothetical protein
MYYSYQFSRKDSMEEPQFRVYAEDGSELCTGDLRTVAKKIVDLQLAQELREAGITEVFIPMDETHELEGMVKDVQSQLEHNFKLQRDRGVTNPSLRIPF